MKVKIKRFDKNLPLPEYKTKGATCVDLYCRKKIIIQPGKVQLVPLNIAIEIPKNCWAMIAPRSSTFKLGLIMANSIAIGDWDYRGDDDEYMSPFFNFTKKSVTIDKGMRVAQMMIMTYEKIEFIEVNKLAKKSRGGFGSTGKR